MGNLIGNIRNRRVAYLEQACERYAIMVYEVLRRELAMGFKSITYSYRGSDQDAHVGTFTATLVPWEQTSKYRHGHRSTEITFCICADSTEDCWHLSGGKAIDIESGMEMTICFSSDGRRVVIYIPCWDEIRYASNADHDQHAVTPLDREPWGNLVDTITI